MVLREIHQHSSSQGRLTSPSTGQSGYRCSGREGESPAVYPYSISFTKTCQKHLDTLAKTMGHTSTAADKSE